MVHRLFDYAAEKNPDFAELIRGRTGKVYGSLFNLLTMMKGLPLSYDRDLQEDKEPLFAAFDTVKSCVAIFNYMISSAKFNIEKMRESCDGGFLNATDLADYLVKKGVPFRTAHGISAKAVRLAIEKRVCLEDLTLEEFKECSPKIEGDIYDAIKIESCVEARKTLGGTAAESTKKQIAALKKFVATRRDASNGE